MNGHMTYLDSQAQRALPGAARQSFITAIVGNIPNVSVKKGIDNYVDYIEHQMSECCLASADILTQILGPRDNGIGINELLEATVTVAKILNDLSSKSSLNDIAENLLAHFQTTGPTETREEFLRSARQLVFASIGWISMLYIPVPDLSGAAFGILEPAATVPLRQSLHHLSNSWKRPVGAMFRTMGVLPISCPVVPPVHKGSQVTGKPLSVSNLCYWSLRKTGKLSIAWIDSMTDHCAFDATRKELKLFRFPAFCVQTYGGHPGVRVLSSILKAHSCHHDCQNDIPDASDAYLLEILLSYRLIFGQDKRSRKLFRDKEISNLSTDRLRDPVLHILCGEKNAYAVTDLIGRFREREVFIPEDDFPQFGERLLKLQEYMVNQRPMGWNAVWNDHRDPQQSFAFWAVVIVGGCSIFLSFAQLVVSVAQLVYAAK